MLRHPLPDARPPHHPLLLVQRDTTVVQGQDPAKVRPPNRGVGAKNGKKLEDGLYRGTLRRGGHRAGCGCAVGEQGEEIPHPTYNGDLGSTRASAQG